MDDPLRKFEKYWQTALQDSPLRQKSAICISTVNPEGFPEGRFVDLKEVGEGGFIFCSSYDSKKAQHIADQPKAAMTIWWDHIGLQVRAYGVISKTNKSTSERYWQSRSTGAQLTSVKCQQSSPLQCLDTLRKEIEELRSKQQDSDISKPENWGGYLLKPESIEFLTFSEDRLHLREEYALKENGWEKGLLQP